MERQEPVVINVVATPTHQRHGDAASNGPTIGDSEQRPGGQGSPAGRELVVLTPSRLRVDSRVVLGHSTAQWLTNAIFCVLILLKVLHWERASIPVQY